MIKQLMDSNFVLALLMLVFLGLILGIIGMYLVYIIESVMFAFTALGAGYG